MTSATKAKILALLQSKSDADLFKGIKLLTEEGKNPDTDPIILALINRVLKPLTKEVVLELELEKSHGNA